ncbi:MAG: glycoside hydrolase family 3 C-terminal domain-containing protein [Opitutaceae bacterium]|nr:glycoside hydrolase family 3 C-terminal domain-containing protein [Opitutaceae bacterium]
MKTTIFFALSASALPFYASANDIDFRTQAQSLVSQLTLEEKAALCSGRDMWSTKPIERLGIPSIVLTDGPHGVRRTAPDAAPGNLSQSLPATCFPTAPGLAATWNVELIEEVGVALGREAQARGVQILLGPGANMKRSPLGGRNFEYFSEDPILAGRLSTAWIRGVQSQGVGASIKHFAANNQEWERMVSDSIVDERTLHEIYLPAFEMAVKDAQPWTVMCSYNKLNGTYVSQHRGLLTDVLRGKWGYRGLVVSDWGAVDDRVAGVQAGLDLEMPGSNGLNDRRIVAAVISGRLDIAVLDARVTDILELTLRAHAAAKPGATFDADAHHALARRAAGEGIVLLKNDGNTLPIDPARAGRIAVIGGFARFARHQGAGSSQVNPIRLDNVVDELGAIVGAKNLTFAAGYDVDGGTTDALLAEAREAAKKADRAIVVIGLPDSFESEGFDRKNLDLPAGHNRLVEAVMAVQPDTIVVLMNGSPVAMPWAPRVKAIVEAYLGGQAGAGAIADVLTGRVNPSGRLAETFPARIEDTPAFPNFPGRNGQALYGEGLFVGYRSYDARRIAPQFPFGFGLSYTTFAYTGIKSEAANVKAQDGVRVHVSVMNTGKRAGAEVVQLYVRQLGGSVLRPDKELKHFAKVTLAPGEEKTVTFALTVRDFAWYDVRVHDWVVDTGSFELLAGGSSRELPLKQVLAVEGFRRGHPKLTRYSPLGELAGHPASQALYEQFVQGALATAPAADPTDSPEAQAAARKARDTIVVFMNEMPLCKLVQVSGGVFSEEMLQGILQAVNQGE